MKLYNTLTRCLEEVEPLEKGLIKTYNCGPTVYDHTHLGHMRIYTNFDVLVRVLKYLGYKVKYVMNITDVGHLFGDGDQGDDKIENQARKEKKTAWDIAREYEKEFFDTMSSLNVKKPNIVCRATEYIQEMIDFIKVLEQKNFTYKISAGIYFDSSKIKDYNALSGMPLDKLREGARIEKDKEKKNPTDFALWRFSPKDKQRQMEWDSPWGKGFPGWHIECSTMSIKHLGKQFDIHAGGEDLIMVHHTNERAQNIAFTGHPVVKLWLHNTFLMIDGKKMSKSLGNFYWSKHIYDRNFDMMALRYLFLTAHYRTRLNFTWEGLAGAQSAYQKLKNHILEWRKDKSVQVDKKKIKTYQNKFKKLISNDVDLPKAIALVWEIAKSELSSATKLALVLDFDRVLGLNLGDVEDIKIPAKIKKLAEKRQEFRENKDWQKADVFRQQILDLGWQVKDVGNSFELKKM